MVVVVPSEVLPSVELVVSVVEVVLSPLDVESVVVGVVVMVPSEVLVSPVVEVVVSLLVVVSVDVSAGTVKG